MRLAYITWGALVVIVSYVAALHVLLSMGDAGLALLFGFNGILVVLSLMTLLRNEGLR